MGGITSFPATSEQKPFPSEQAGNRPSTSQNFASPQHDTDTDPDHDQEYDGDTDPETHVPTKPTQSDGDSAAGSAATDPTPSTLQPPSASESLNLKLPPRSRRTSSAASAINANSTFLTRLWRRTPNNKRRHLSSTDPDLAKATSQSFDIPNHNANNSNISHYHSAPASRGATFAPEKDWKSTDDLQEVPLRDDTSTPYSNHSIKSPQNVPFRSDGDIIYSAPDETEMMLDGNSVTGLDHRRSSASISSLATSAPAANYRHRASIASTEFPDQVSNRPTKEVQVVKGKTRSARRRQEMEAEDCNQTGQSIYEMRIQDSYFSTPARTRPREYVQMQEADQSRRDSRAAKKQEKRASREVRKEENLRRKGKAAPPPPDRGTVQYAIQDAKRIGVLNLCRMGLDRVPDVVFEDIPGTTRVINISFNNLDSLDPKFTEFVLVQRLVLNGNFLQTLPSSIVKMTELRTLDLARNKLAQLPDVFASMTRLENVNLSDNHLTSLPDSFASLSLVTLNLSGNSITVPPRVIEAMYSLEKLFLNKNRIVAVPPAWSSLPHLQTLNLDENFIADLPDIFLSECQTVFDLSIRRNPLKMSRLRSKPSWCVYEARRLAYFRHRIDNGSKSLEDLDVADP